MSLYNAIVITDYDSKITYHDVTDLDSFVNWIILIDQRKKYSFTGNRIGKRKRVNTAVTGIK